MHLPWLKTLGFLQNKLKTPGHGVKAFHSWEPVSIVFRHSLLFTSKALATTGSYWLFWADSFYIHTSMPLIMLFSLFRVPFPLPCPTMNLPRSFRSRLNVTSFLCPSLMFCHHPGRINLSWLGSKNISYMSLIMSYFIVDNLFSFLSFLLKQKCPGGRNCLFHVCIFITPSFLLSPNRSLIHFCWMELFMKSFYDSFKIRDQCLFNKSE